MLARTEKPAHLDQKDPKVHPDHLEPMVNQDLRDRLDHREIKARRVSVRSTVPWMVAFSSRMERDDKRDQACSIYNSNYILCQSSFPSIPDNSLHISTAQFVQGDLDRKSVV